MSSESETQRVLEPKRFRAAHCGQLVGVDTIELSGQGRHGYVLALVDLYSQFAFALGTHLHTDAASVQFLDHVLQVFPGTVEAVLSDNGHEFQGGFDKDLKERGVRHYIARPKSPNMNVHVERFKRVVQEEFVQFEQDLLFTDVPLFNESLLEWLMFYNTERPHHSLGDLSPLEFLVQEQGLPPE